jgi:hypothetical protein
MDDIPTSMDGDFCSVKKGSSDRLASFPAWFDHFVLNLTTKVSSLFGILAKASGIHLALLVFQKSKKVIAGRIGKNKVLHYR